PPRRMKTRARQEVPTAGTSSGRDPADASAQRKPQIAGRANRLLARPQRRPGATSGGSWWLAADDRSRGPFPPCASAASAACVDSEVSVASLDPEEEAVAEVAASPDQAEVVEEAAAVAASPDRAEEEVEVAAAAAGPAEAAA